MKKGFQLKTLIPVFILLITGLYGCRVQEVEVTGFRGIRLNRISGKQIGVEVLMQVRNPNNFSFQITGIDLDFTLNGRYLGKLMNEGKTTIPPRSEGIHNFYLNIELDSWVSGLTTFINMIGRKKATIEISGHIRVRSSPIWKTIPVEEKAEVDILP